MERFIENNPITEESSRYVKCQFIEFDDSTTTIIPSLTNNIISKYKQSNDVIPKVKHTSFSVTKDNGFQDENQVSQYPNIHGFYKDANETNTVNTGMDIYLKQQTKAGKVTTDHPILSITSYINQQKRKN